VIGDDIMDMKLFLEEVKSGTISIDRAQFLLNKVVQQALPAGFEGAVGQKGPTSDRVGERGQAVDDTSSAKDREGAR
jgi:hypothetical protein